MYPTPASTTGWNRGKNLTGEAKPASWMHTLGGSIEHDSQVLTSSNHLTISRWFPRAAVCKVVSPSESTTLSASGPETSARVTNCMILRPRDLTLKPRSCKEQQYCHNYVCSHRLMRFTCTANFSLLCTLQACQVSVPHANIYISCINNQLIVRTARLLQSSYTGLFMIRAHT